MELCQRCKKKAQSATEAALQSANETKALSDKIRIFEQQLDFIERIRKQYEDELKSIENSCFGSVDKAVRYISLLECIRYSVFSQIDSGEIDEIIRQLTTEGKNPMFDNRVLLGRAHGMVQAHIESLGKMRAGEDITEKDND